MSSIKKNFSYNILYQILILILPLITAPYISRIIGPEGIGIYSYTYSIVNYFAMFAMLGMSNYGNRTIAKSRDNPNELNKKFSSLYKMQFITAMISTIIYIFYIQFFGKQYEMYYYIQLIYLISTFFNINWLFFGLEQFKLTVIRNTIIKFILTISIFVFVKHKEDLMLYMLILALSNLLSDMALWPFIIKYVKFTRTKVKDVIKHFKPDIILFIPIIAISVYKMMDKIMLGNMVNIIEVGLYENAEKIINVPLGLITALGTVMLPRISNLVQKGNVEKSIRYIDKSMEFITFLSIPITFGLMVTAKTFVPIYFGNKFLKTADLIICLAITIPFMSWANVIRTQYLIPNEKDKIFIVSVILGAVVNIGLNYILIPIYQSIGAAIGTIFAEITVMLYQTYKIRENIKTKQYLKYVLNFSIKGLIMYIITMLLQYVINNEYILLIAQILLGVFIYAILNYKYILKNISNIPILKN